MSMAFHKSIIAELKDYCSIDIETTGLSNFYCDIIEIAAVRVRDGQIVDVFQTLLNPGYSIPSFITSLTGITNKMVSDAPTFIEVLFPLLDFLGDDVILGHNVSFDLNFIRVNCEKFGIHFSRTFMDSMTLFKRLCPNSINYKLQTMISYLDIMPTTAHRALADCTQTHLCYQKLLQIAHDNGIDVNKLKRQPSLRRKTINL